MFRLQFFNCPLDIPDLVRLGHLAVALQVDERLSLPWRFEDMMAAAHPGFAENMSAEIQ